MAPTSCCSMVNFHLQARVESMKGIVQPMQGSLTEQRNQGCALECGFKLKFSG